MGCLRFLLAFSVMWTHAGLPHGFSADLCVMIFFAISGFYMTLVLNENSSYRLVKTFYWQRAMRIYPTYLVVLLLAICFNLALFLSGKDVVFLRYFEQIKEPIISGVLWAFSQIFIIGQDISCFFGIDSRGGVTFQPSMHLAINSLAHANLVPPAWSLSTELMFYILAPYILTRSTLFILFIFVLSLLLRIILSMNFGFDQDPWTTRFFPAQLSFFLLGSFGYKFAISNASESRVHGYMKYFIVVGVAVSSLWVNKFIKSDQMSVRLIVFTIVFFLIFAIPMLFKATKKNLIDRKIGELSFPLYVCHILVFEVGHYFVISSRTFDLILAFVAILVSLIFVYFIDKPIDIYRHQLLVKKRRFN